MALKHNTFHPYWRWCLSSALALSPLSLALAEERAGEFTKKVETSWGNKNQLNVTVNNPFNEGAEYWEVSFDHAGPIQIWNADLVSQDGNHYVYRQPAYEIKWVDQGMPANASKSFGMIVDQGALQNLTVTLVGMPESNADQTDTSDQDNNNDASNSNSGSDTSNTDNTDQQDTSDNHSDSDTHSQTAQGAVSISGGDWYKTVEITHTGNEAVSTWTLQFKYDGQLQANAFWGISEFKNLGNGLYEITVQAPSWKQSGFENGDVAQLGVNVDGEHTLYDFVLNGQALDSSQSGDNNTGDQTQDNNNDSSSDTTGDTNTDGQDQSDNTNNDSNSDDASSDDSQSKDHHNDSGAAPDHGKRVVAYFTSWGIYGRDYQVADIPGDKITHINYAFVNVDGSKLTCKIGDPWADTDKVFGAEKGLPAMSWDENVTPADERGNFGRLLQLKEKYPHLKTLISVGGWTWSKHFSDAALTQASREKFVASCVDMMNKYGFDGIDIDWEYPVGGGLADNTYRPEDKENYTLLMKEFRKQLNNLEQTTGHDYLLTIAAPAGYDKFANLELKQLANTLDFINLMSYDLHGAWDNMTNHQAHLYMNPSEPSSYDVRRKYNVDYAVQSYLQAGVPADKLVVGLPFYARAWQGVNCNVNNGLYQPSSGAASGTWEKGNYDYWDVVAKVPANRIFFDEHAEASYACHNGIFYTFDTPKSMENKIDYLKYHGLGGVMFWELSGDVRDTQSNKNLLNVIDTHL